LVEQLPLAVRVVVSRRLDRVIEPIRTLIEQIAERKPESPDDILDGTPGMTEDQDPILRVPDVQRCLPIVMGWARPVEPLLPGAVLL
jgi:hypothetical protein